MKKHIFSEYTFFSEYGHVAYQFKGNEAFNGMLVNTLTIHTPSTPGVRSKGHFFFFSKISQVALYRISS